MQEAIEARKLILLDGLDVAIWGTYHKSCVDISDALSNPIERDRVGVLFLNSLSPTRAGHGDSAVYWADAFAERGYPSFRIDLPGFGDSAGDTPTELLGYIHQGRYAPLVSAKITELVARFNLSGVVIVGLCVGAVSALYSAAVSKDCVGLVLLDPGFELPQAAPKIRQELSFWALQSRLGAGLRSIYRLLKKMRLFLHGNALPEDANFPLLRCWKELASEGLPILLFNSSMAKSRVGEYDYLKYILGLAGHGSQVVLKSPDSTNHPFSNRAGQAAVRQHTEQWLNTFFPLRWKEEAAGRTVHCDPNDKEVHANITRTTCNAISALGS